MSNAMTATKKQTRFDLVLRAAQEAFESASDAHGENLPPASDAWDFILGVYEVDVDMGNRDEYEQFKLGAPMPAFFAAAYEYLAGFGSDELTPTKPMPRMKG